ncbi:hypothetical protein M408DRAFT_61759 [Serendipita vermifera MAFF 305830]|uniref:Yeast cell wall synthesis Kre9/Knh1-like N-terminal domain-containing protein n=1 Tax=Serendipita vermifera MAFF 305830 TaxID=933852 RepID=A0A0C3BMI4_SERVB|nr:hypothetical protein M408DRAFT_61759 [Serendipita vermifera MAFF 305830]
MFILKVVLLVTFQLTLIVRAYRITTPSDSGVSGESWTSAGPNTITWERVSTDPDTFSVVLVNEDRSLLPMNQILASNVDGTALSIAISPASGETFPLGNGFRINFIKSDNEMNTIYAQSSQFRIFPGNDATNTGKPPTTTLASSTLITGGPTTTQT